MNNKNTKIYQFLLKAKDPELTRCNIRITKVKANDYDGAKKQVITRFPPDKYYIESYLDPEGKLHMVENTYD